jgi:hypothetical protein
LCLCFIILIVQEYHAWASRDFRSGAKAFFALLADLSLVSLATINDSREIHFPAAVFSVRVSVYVGAEWRRGFPVRAHQGTPYICFLFSCCQGASPCSHFPRVCHLILLLGFPHRQQRFLVCN